MFFKHLTENIRSIAGYLGEDNVNEYITSFGARVEPLGITKLKLIEVILNLIRLNNVKMNREIALQKIYPKLMVKILHIIFNGLHRN